VSPAPGLLRLLHLQVGLPRKAAKRQYSKPDQESSGEFRLNTLGQIERWA
jgi:hypothetical protein